MLKDKYNLLFVQKNFYSSSTNKLNKEEEFNHYLAGEPLNKDNKFLLKERPNFITGLSDAEGTFIISIRPAPFGGGSPPTGET